MSTTPTPAIQYGSQKISSKTCNHLIDTAAQSLRSFGITKGDIAAIHSPNNPEYLILIQALWRIGAISCHLNIRTPIPALLKELRRSRCRVLIVHGKKFPQKIPAVKQVLLKNIFSLRPHTGTKPKAIPLNQKVTILFTSGSSGSPKAVTHTYGNHYYNARGSNKNIPVKPGDCWLLSLPLYHVSGLSILFRTAIGGGAIVIPQENEDIISAIKKHHVTHISLVTTQLHRLLQDKKNIPALRKLKAILLGGGPIAPNLLKTAKKQRLPVYITYGLTEMASQVATSPKPGAGAKILNYRQIKIARDGEIMVKGKTLCGGTKGWHATGDLGHLDKNNYLTVLGRKDNMFISGGENIYPEEIERHMLSVPGVAQAVVVPQADPEFGQRPAAFIDGNIPPSRIISQLERRLPRFKVPRTLYPWPASLPPGIKLQRQIFRELLKRGHMT